MFQALSKTFAAKVAAVKTNENKAEGGNAPSKSSKKKTKALKVLDPKSAQNLCELQFSLLPKECMIDSRCFLSPTEERMLFFVGFFSLFFLSRQSLMILLVRVMDSLQN